MSIQLPTINSASGGDTFQNWVDKTNGIINTVANSVVTTGLVVNGATTNGNAFVIGIFGANTLACANLAGGNVQSQANLTITTNVNVIGVYLSVGNSTVNSFQNSTTMTQGNVLLSGSILSIGNTTVNSVINSTALVLAPNATLTGTSLNFGNSTVNAVVNTTGFYTGGVAAIYATQRDRVFVNGVAVGTGTYVNFIGSGSTTVTGTVDAGNNSINVVVSSSASLPGGAGGSNTNILFNDGGLIGGVTGLSFDKTANNLQVGNVVTIAGGATSINGSIFFSGNSTVNCVGNSTADVFSNSTVTVTYGLSGATVGANVSISTLGHSIGNSTVNTQINSTSVSTASHIFTANVTGGNVLITTSNWTIGNSTVNTFANSVVFINGINTINSTAITIGANVVANSSTILIGNSTLSYTATQTTLQVANSTVASVINSTGLQVGANLVVAFDHITIGNTTVNTFANSTALTTGAANATSLGVGANVVLTTTNWTVGNSTVNAASNSTSLVVGTSVVNSTVVAAGANVVLSTTTMTVGNSTVNVSSNSTVLFLGNSTVSSTINSTTFSGTSSNATNLNSQPGSYYLAFSNFTGALTAGQFSGAITYTANNLNTNFDMAAGRNITAVGDITASFSDIRLKDVKASLAGPQALKICASLSSIYYEPNTLAMIKGLPTSGKRQIGLVAQEVKEVLPEVVSLAAFDLNPVTGASVSGDDYMTISYERIVPVLVQAINQLNTELQALKKELKR